MIDHLARGQRRAALFACSLLVLLAGCAAAPIATSPGNVAAAGTAVAAAAGPASGASAASQGGAHVKSPVASGKPFAAVIQGATRIDGLFTLYRRDEKVWIALRPEDFGKPFFLSPKIARGIGEAGLYGGTMDTPQVIEFRRVYNQVQMIARNTRYTAPPGTPEGRAVAAAFSPSLLASAAVASQPEAQTHAVLVEMNALFIGDILGLGTDLQRTYRQGYGFDARNSAIVAVRGKPDTVSLEVLAHYATGSIARPQAGGPSTPQSLPDARSLFMTLHYSIARLPEQAMQPRASDSRIGYFTTRREDFGDDVARTPTRRYVQRWRLEKQDPAAALSEPVKPIVYWLDRTIPLKYRDSIRAGILEWNQAFERIGFKDAIVVKVQPDDADFDTLDFGHASVRWMTNSEPRFGAIGPSHVDPRSGEILDADIAIESLSSRHLRALRAQVLAPATDWSRVMQAPPEPGPRHEPFDPHACVAVEQGADQLAYALDVLDARGAVDPAESDAFVQDYLKSVTMHEVGHTLGLRHNFRASRLYSDAQLSDPAFTRTHALTGSVMEYAPVNLAAPGAPAVAPFQTTLGPYDYWAIEYGYKPLAPAEAAHELAQMAARSGAPEFGYATDEDNYLGIDPEALQFDLGSDVVAFAKKRIAIAHELFRRQEGRHLPPDQDYTVLRRSLGYAISDVGRAVGVLARQIGGVRTLRDFPGSGRDPLQPVSAAAQRAALDTMSRGLLAADSFVVSPALQRRLAPDYEERSEALVEGSDAVATDFVLPHRIFAVQRSLLSQLMSDTVATRIIDSQGKARQPGDAFQLSELYARLQHDIWSELAAHADIPPARRELQRDYVNRMAELLLRPNAASRVDMRSLMRVEAQTLLGQMRGALRQPGLGVESRAHLQDSAETLTRALAAPLQRVGA